MVLDVESGSVHVVDDLSYDVIGLYGTRTLKEIQEELSGYEAGEIEEVYEEIRRLESEGALFTKDEYEDYITEFKRRPTVVKALCLHIAHDCNLACRYCFAEEGEYHGDRSMMSFEVGKQALDFLVENSGSRRNLEVDFFGGEPLMNFEVVKQLVAYGRSLEEKHSKKFRFTLTTNGVLLDDEVMEFANREMANVVLSIDGRKEVHDKMRPTRNGKGSYDLIIGRPELLTGVQSTCHLLAHDRLVLLTPAGHPLAGRPAVPLEELSGESFILMHPSSSIYRLCLTACQKKGFQPAVTRTAKIESIVSAVAAGEAVSLLPYSNLDVFRHENVAVIPLQEPVAADVVLACQIGRASCRERV